MPSAGLESVYALASAGLGTPAPRTTLATHGHSWPDSDDSTRAAIGTVMAARADSLRTADCGRDQFLRIEALAAIKQAQGDEETTLVALDMLDPLVRQQISEAPGKKEAAEALFKRIGVPY